MKYLAILSSLMAQANANNQRAVIGEKLGEGSFGAVYKCTINNEVFARKVFHRTQEKNCYHEYKISTAISKAMINLECNVGDTSKLNRAKHCFNRLAIGKTILKRQTGICNRPFAIDFDLAIGDLEKVAFQSVRSGGDDALSKCPQFNTADLVRGVLEDCLSGLMFLHEHAHIIHCDIKPANLLLFGNGAVKLADFGLAYRWKAGGATIYDNYVLEQLNIGCVLFQAPEIWLNDVQANGKSDVFSLATTLYDVFEGKTLIEMTEVMYKQFNKWQATRAGTAYDAMKTAFTVLMADWHSSEINKSRFGKLAVGKNLQSCYLMSASMSGLLREMMAFSPVDRPTPREARHQLLVNNHEPAATATAAVPDAAAQPPTVIEQEDDLNMLFSTLDGLLPPSVGINSASIDLNAQFPELGDFTNAAVAMVEDTTMLNHQVAAEQHSDDAAVVVVDRSGEDAVEETAVYALKRKRNSVDRAKAARLVVKKMRQQMKRDGDIDKGRLLTTLERKQTALYQAARTIFQKAQAANTAAGLSREEQLLLVAVEDLAWDDTIIKGSSDPRRLLFEAVTKRGTNWWHKNHKRVLAEIRGGGGGE